MNEQEEFLARIADNEWNTAVRQVYADWLEEHDQPKEAVRQRKIVPAMYALDDIARVVKATYAEMVAAGHAAAEGGRGIGVGDPAVAPNFRGVEPVVVMAQKFWSNWEIVTGIKVSNYELEPFECCA